MTAPSVSTDLASLGDRRASLPRARILLTIGTIVWLCLCYRIITAGLRTFGIDSYGATWGILVANAVHLIGISHVGIAISAAVRVLRLDRYRSVARIAELTTVVALLMAFTNLLLHVGRPDRFLVNVFLYGRWHSPMVWSLTVFVLYFLASSTYLYLSLRRDLALSTSPSVGRSFSRALSLGYLDSKDSRERHERVLFWLALCLVPIMVSVHSVYGLLFGMISAKAGWYNPLQAPYFVLGAAVSGFSAILIIVALFRLRTEYRDLLEERIFRAFSVLLAFLTFLYIYFTISEHLTAQYLPRVGESAVSKSLLIGPFAIQFWLTLIVGLALPLVILLVQAVRAPKSGVRWTVGAAILINLALWMKRYLIVVPAQLYAWMAPARASVDYRPTITEWGVVLGSYFAGGFIFLLLTRVIPLFETDAEDRAEPAFVGRSTRRRLIMSLTLAIGLLLISWGVATRAADFAPIKWLAGIILLIAIPVEACLIEDGRRSKAEEGME